MDLKLDSVFMSLWSPLFFYFLKLINFFFFFGCVGSLLLHMAFSSCGEQGLLFVAVHGLLIAVASVVVEHGL